MKHILFSNLSNNVIDVAMIEAITLDIYALKVTIEHTIFQVHIDNTDVYYANCLKNMCADLSCCSIRKVLLHETPSFYPSLGFLGKTGTPRLLDSDFQPV